MPALRYSVAGATAPDWSLPAACDDRWFCYGRQPVTTGEDDHGDKLVMKPLVGIALAFTLGFACRAFGIPSPAPPLILGALLVMAMTIGYLAMDRWSMSPAKHAPDCGGPSGLTASQIPHK
jgi:XapX domain-containing protein